MEIVSNADNFNMKDTLQLNIIILQEDNKVIDSILSKYNKINFNDKKFFDSNYEIYQQKVCKMKIKIPLNIMIQFIKINNPSCFDELAIIYRTKINFLISKNINYKSNKNFTDEQCKFIKKFHNISKEIFLIQNKNTSGSNIEHFSRNCFIENFIISKNLINFSN